MSEQLSFDFDDEPTRPRIQYSLRGEANVTVDLDPAEFRGMSIPQITEEVKAVLSGIAPHVDFFENDLVSVAHALADH